MQTIVTMILCEYFQDDCTWYEGCKGCQELAEQKWQNCSSDMAQHYIRSAFMSEYYGRYLDSFESQEAWLYCVIFAAYTTLLNNPIHSKLSKSAKHLNSTVTHCIVLSYFRMCMFRCAAAANLRHFRRPTPFVPRTSHVLDSRSSSQSL
jgi:hypothetical protein